MLFYSLPLEMTTVFPTSNGPELAVNGSKNPKERSSSLSSANSYTIDKPAEQENGGGKLREKETNGSISPTSESNESTTSTSQTCAKVYKTLERIATHWCLCTNSVFSCVHTINGYIL